MVRSDAMYDTPTLLDSRWAMRANGISVCLASATSKDDAPTLRRRAILTSYVVPTRPWKVLEGTPTVLRWLSYTDSNGPTLTLFTTTTSSLAFGSAQVAAIVAT